MADFIFDPEGKAHGFRLGDFVYTTSGKAVGRVYSDRVYRLDGTYVGALHKNMIVEKPGQCPRDREPILHPGNCAAPPACQVRSRAMGMTYPDVFPNLVRDQSKDAECRAAPDKPRIMDDDDFFGD